MAAGTDLSSPWAATVPPETAITTHRRHFAPPLDRPPRSALGGWWRRVAANLTDTFLGVLVLAPVLALAALAAPVSSGLSVAVALAGYVLILAFYVWQLVRQGRTGATYGKELLGLRLVGEMHGRPVGVGSSLARPFVHIIDGLPLYLGYLWPLWDGKRQTFTDKAMSTLVLRVPRRRPSLPLAALSLTVTGLLLAGSLTALAETAPDLDLDEPVGEAAPASVGPIVPAPFTPALPEQVGPLPAEDVEGRLAPVAAGYAPVSDDVTELGALSVADTAALAATSPEEASLTEKALQSFGLQGAFGRGFDGSENAYATLVYRFADPDGATTFVEGIGVELSDSSPGTVPGSVLYGGDLGEGSLAGVFAYGSFVYEVTIFGEPGTFGDVDRRVLLERQYDHAVKTG